MNEKEVRSRKRKKILFSCLGISLVLHVATLFIFYKNPPSYINTLQGTFNRTLGLLENPVEEDKNDLLEEVFEDFEIPSSQSVQPFDREKNALSLSSKPLMEELKDPPFLSPIQPLEIKDPSLKEIPMLKESNNKESLALIETTPSLDSPFSDKELALLPYPFGMDFDAFSDESLPTTNALSENSLAFQHATESATTGELLLATPPATSLVDLPKIAEQPPQKHPLLVFQSFNQPVALGNIENKKPHALPEIDHYSLPETLSSLEWGMHFNMETEVIPDPEGDGYIFFIHLKPRTDLSAHKMKQNFTFLIDRSNSIDKHCYESFKKAVYRTLSYLPEGDTFNIIIFDRKIFRLSNENLPISRSSIHYAKQFLAKQESGNFFTATEIYPMIEKALPSQCPDADMNTIFVLSDGNTLFSLKKQKNAMQKIIEKNNGKCAIYTAAAGLGNNIVLLDLLSSSNRGSLFYSRTYASFPRKFVSAVTRLRNPLLKDISFKCEAADPHLKIPLYPSPYCAPSLYNAEPYVIMGKTKTLIDFNLSLEGRNGNQWITINKEISLSNAKKGAAGLEKKWALQGARLCYENFLKKGDGNQLKEAKLRLQTCSNIAFE